MAAMKAGLTDCVVKTRKSIGRLPFLIGRTCRQESAGGFGKRRRTEDRAPNSCERAGRLSQGRAASSTLAT